MAGMKGKKSGKSLLICALVPIIIIVLIAGFFVSIVDGIVGIITDIVKSVVEFFKHPGRYFIVTGALLQNDFSRLFNISKFNEKEFDDYKIKDPKVFLPLDEFNQMVENLEANIDRDTVGLDNITIKKMLLTYYRSSYLSNTTILIELADGEEKNINAPFQTGKFKETEDAPEKTYLYVKGAISISLNDEEGKDTDINMYTQDALNGLYNVYADAVKKNKDDYAEAVKKYLLTCYAIEGQDIIMHKFDESIIDTSYYYGNTLIGTKRTVNENVHNTVTLDYTIGIEQYTTPVEFMTNLMSITGSQDFINEFMKIAISKGNTKVKIYNTSNETVTETTETYSQRSEVFGKKPAIEYGAAVQSEQNGKTILKRVKSEEEPIEGEEKVNLKVTNDSGKDDTIYLLKNGERVSSIGQHGVTIYQSVVLKKDEEYTFSDLDKPSQEEKVKTDSNIAKKVVTETTVENGYDIGLVSVENWFIKTDQTNVPITKTTYYTKNNKGEEIIIDKKSEALTTTEPARALEEYNNTKHPNILRSVKNIDWPIQERDSSKKIVQDYDRDGYLNSIFNYTIKKPETDYNWIDYNFDRMNIAYESDISKTVLITNTQKTMELSVPTSAYHLEDFLALLSNADGKPKTGQPFKAKQNGGKAIEYDDVYDGKSKVGDLLENGLEPLCQILDTAYTDDQICNTEGLSTIMRYIMYVYSGNDYGVTSLDASIFGIGTMTSIASGNELLVEYIHKWENSGGPPTNKDGSKYIVEDDGYGHLTVGYGVDIEKSGYKQTFLDSGYSIKKGAEIDKDFVDAIEKKIIASAIEQVKSMTAGIYLTEYQINALVSRAYNCGNYGAVGVLRGSPKMNFTDSYKAYWQQERDDKFEAKNNNADFTHKLYTQYMSAPTQSNGTNSAGLERRRKSEWTLFSTGYYDILNKWHSEAGDIMRAAERVHNQQLSWSYYSKTDELFWNDIEQSINNPNKKTCCATFVSSVIYVARFATEEQMNSFNYNLCSSLYTYFANAGWEVINSYDNLEAGDIVFIDNHDGGDSYDHVQLYAGDDTWYNAGSTEAIQRPSPYSQGQWAKQNFYVALRPTPIS